jgi:hypothetical protein
MKRNLFASALALLAVVLMTSSVVVAQTTRQASGTTKVKTATDAATIPAQTVPLPASDAVVFVDVRRLLTEALPRALVSDAAKLAQVNAEIDNFKARTGIDARSFERVAVGARFTNPSAGVTKIDHVVAVANGTFNAAALAAAGRLAAKGKYQEVTHGGKTINVYSLNEQVKLFGLLNMRISDLATAALDANTLAVGDPAGVRAAIDAQAGSNRVSPEMVMLARRNPNAIIGFGGTLPPALTQNLDLGNEEIAKSIASIREFYGSLGTTNDGFDMLTVLRTATAGDAKNLSDTLAALKQLAPLFLSQLSGDKGKLAQSAVDSLKVTAQGTEVQLSLALAQTDIATMVRVF